MTDVRTWVETVEEVLTAIKDRDHQIEELRSRLERTRDRQVAVKDQRIRKIQKYKREIVKIARALGIQGPAEVDEYCAQIRRKARDLHTETQELRAKLEETRLEMRTGRATKFIDNSDLLLALKARDAGRDQQIKQLRAELEEERAKGDRLAYERRMFRRRLVECRPWVGVCPLAADGIQEMCAVRDLADDALTEVPE